MDWHAHPGRLVRTLLHLTPTQLFWYPIRRLQSLRPAPAPRAPGGRAPSTWEAARQELVAWGPGDGEARRSRADAICRGEYLFLNHPEHLSSIDWTRTYVSPLWTYRLQSFEWATDLAWTHCLSGDGKYLRTLAALLESWLQGAAARRGLGWDPYVVSSRAIQWCYTLLLVAEALPPELVDRMITSLLTQLGGLERRRELHLQANHLQRNLSALAMGGLLFEGPVPSAWRRRWVPAMWSEFLRQVTPDGVHAERSPMYHGLALVDLLEIVCLAKAVGEPVPAAVVDRGRAMGRVWSVLSRGDGTIHLINDSANGEVPAREYLAHLASRAWGGGAPLSGAVRLPDAGFVAWIDNTSGERLLIDAAPPGPAHQPGHAHAGLLSFELDLAGRPVVVDSGLSGYDGDPFRDYVRSSRAHNTVTVDGLDQAELWGTFRVGGRPTMLSADMEDRPFRFRGAYRPFHGRRIRHERRIGREADGAWVVEDEVSGAAGRRVESYLHFHPDFEVSMRPDGFQAIAPGCRVAGTILGGAQWRVVRGVREPPQGWYCPAFGVVQAAATVILMRDPQGEQSFGVRLRRVLG